MGPTQARLRGIGSGLGGVVNAPPTAPGNGSGGGGSLLTGGGGGFDTQPASSEISDAFTGRITLGIVNLTILALLGFYIVTRSQQAGA